MVCINLDLSSAPKGNIRPLHGVNSGPMTKVFTYDARKYFCDAKFPYSRLHDVEYPYGSGEFVDIPCIFKNFDADEDLEESYNFGLSDEYIKQIVLSGSKPFFRLGVSIEHAPVKRYIYPPKDYQKWARICEHIIMHYNEGWAGGFTWNSEYWEIWNEADGRGNMWLGTPEEFYELYCVSATHLKKRFPHLKIGGCGFTRAKNAFTEGFLKYISSKEEYIPLDFYSWHRYFTDPKVMTDEAEFARALLCKYDRPAAESIFDEWNYMRNWQDQFDSYPIIKNHIGAAFCAAVLCSMQTKTDIEAAMYFEADVIKEWCGLFEVTHMAIGRQKAIVGPLKPYYSFKIFNALYSMKNEIEMEIDGKGIYACAASDRESGNFGMLLTSYGSDTDVEKLHITFENLPESNIEVRLTDSSHTYEKILELPADRDPAHEFAIGLEIERNAVVYVGTPIE